MNFLKTGKCSENWECCTSLQGTVRYETWRQMARHDTQCGADSNLICSTQLDFPMSWFSPCLDAWLWLSAALHTVYCRKWPRTTQNGKTDCESSVRFWIERPNFLFKLPSNHMPISLSFGDIRVWQTDRWTDNTDHYYSWPPHCDGPAKHVTD